MEKIFTRIRKPNSFKKCKITVIETDFNKQNSELNTQLLKFSDRKVENPKCVHLFSNWFSSKLLRSKLLISSLFENYFKIDWYWV